MSVFLIPRQRFTGSMRLVIAYGPTAPLLREAALTNATLAVPTACPNAPNIGRMNTGWGVGIDAFGSPICDQAMIPPLMTISGRAPKNAGRHSTRSASFPTSMDPITCETPWRWRD